MKNQEVTADTSGITFNIPQPTSYRLDWWQIEAHGFDKWINHLTEKRWFTQRICTRFTELCKEHFGWH